MGLLNLFVIGSADIDIPADQFNLFFREAFFNQGCFYFFNAYFIQFINSCCNISHFIGCITKLGKRPK